MKSLWILLAFSILIFVSCIKEPTEPVYNHTVQSSVSGAYILCEGLWGMDNASLDRILIDSNTIENNIYEKVNPGLRLGDLANDAVIFKNRLLIAVTTSKTIESIDLKTGLSLGRLILSGNRAPRKIAVINEDIAAVTDLYGHSIALFNPKTLNLLIDKIPSGPAPEGIAVHDGIMFVVNSGFGDYLANAPKAGSITLIETSNFTELNTVYVAPNPIEILINEKYNTLYVSYNNLPSKKDSVGGIIEFDLSSLSNIRSIKTNVRSMQFSGSKDTLFYISTEGIDMIDLSKKFESKNIIRNHSTNEIWYSLGIAPNGDYWIGNAKNYQVQGEIIIYDKSDYKTPKRKFKTGVNPTKIIFN